MNDYRCEVKRRGRFAFFLWVRNVRLRVGRGAVFVVVLSFVFLGSPCYLGALFVDLGLCFVVAVTRGLFEFDLLLCSGPTWCMQNILHVYCAIGVHVLFAEVFWLFEWVRFCFFIAGWAWYIIIFL